MLEPREADIPILFLVLVVLPLVAYILLGKWSDSAKKKERISLLAQLAAEEAFKAEAMAVADVVPLVASSKNGTHQCVRCSSRATTRCSRCKSVRYWSVSLQLTLFGRKSGNDGKKIIKICKAATHNTPKDHHSRADNF